MFGMGFTEIMVIAVIAILFLGPDKLPQTMVDIARFFRSLKRTVASAKNSIEEELHIEDIRREVDSYKNELLDGKRELDAMASVGDVAEGLTSLADLNEPDETPSPAAEKTPEVVTFSKKKKKKKKQPVDGTSEGQEAPESSKES